MTGRTLRHGTFTIERELPYPPARVFAAWADPKEKAQWFAAATELYRVVIRKQAFRPGGKERVRGEWKTGKISDFQAVYHDIVRDRRIVYVYDMYVDEQKLSVSLATIEFEASGKGTKLILTEQGAYMDGGIDGHAGREQGTGGLVASLEKYLAGG